MNTKHYLVVVDTTELSPQMSSHMRVPRGILNVVVIKALTAPDAKKAFLSLYTPQLIEVLKNCIWVYSLEDDLMPNLKLIEENKSLPIFTHILLSGHRPGRQTDESLDQKERDIEANKVHPAASPVVAELVEKHGVPAAPVVKANPINPVAAINPRNREFQTPDYERPPEQRPLTQQQAELIRKTLGSVPQQGNRGEGYNPRISASTGQNLNLSQPMLPPTSDIVLNNDQMTILEKHKLRVNPDSSGIIQDPDTLVMDEQNIPATTDLAEIKNEDVISDEQIKTLNEELKALEGNK